jgi:hypothetical protein
MTATLINKIFNIFSHIFTMFFCSNPFSFCHKNSFLKYPASDEVHEKTPLFNGQADRICFAF